MVKALFSFSLYIMHFEIKYAQHFNKCVFIYFCVYRV